MLVKSFNSYTSNIRGPSEELFQISKSFKIKKGFESLHANTSLRVEFKYSFEVVGSLTFDNHTS